LSLVGAMDDMQAYLRWGQRANTLGLASAYKGIYFPLQWQIFQVCEWLTRLLALPEQVALRSVTIVFDLGLLAMLALVLRRQGSSAAGALIFWIHPSYLVFSALGYVDAHFAVFALLAGVLADRARQARGYALAGLPLAAAFLMKPQALVLLATAFLYAVVRLIKSGERRSFALFAAPAVLFLGYSLAFAAGGRSFWDLTLSYLEIPAVMPALTANQLNMWCPVSWWVAPGQPLYWVRDTARVVGPLAVRDLAAAATIGLLALFSWRVARGPRQEVGAAPGGRPNRWTLLFGSAALVLPMVMTNAHENHFFLAGVYLIALYPFARGLERVAIHGLLALSGLNLLGLYGLGTGRLAAASGWLIAWRAPNLVALAGALAAVCFAFAAGFELALADGRTEPRRSWCRALALLCAIVCLQAVVIAGWK